MRFKTKILILAYAVLVLFTSCHPWFCVWEMGYSPVNKISATAVTGTYRLTPYSKKMMYYEGGYEHIPESTLVLNADKTYLLISAPDWLIDDYGTSHKKYIDRVGKWDLTASEDFNLSLIGLQEGQSLFSKKGKLYILLTVGDRDSCQGMVYEKI